MKKNPKTDLSQKTNEDKVEYLYQKLGAYWYAFTVVDGVLHYGRVEEEEVFAEELEADFEKSLFEKKNEDEKNA